MSKIDKREQEALNIVRVCAINTKIGVEFSNLVFEFGFEEAKKIMEQISKAANSVDFK